MKVIRALQTIYIPRTPEGHDINSMVLHEVFANELVLVADSFLPKLKIGSYKIYANVNPKFKRDKSGKKAKEIHGYLGN